MRHLDINHVTDYQFSRSVELLPHRLLLRPRENHNVRIESSALEIFPGHNVHWKRDVLDNSVAVVSFTEPSDRVHIVSNVIIQHYEDNPFDFLLDEHAVSHPFHYTDEDRAEVAPFLQAVYPADQEPIQHWMDALELERPMETFVLLGRLSREIANRLLYLVREEPGVQPPAQTLAQNSGSCRDFATLFMEACRHLGMASRFVSGYLYTSDNDANNTSTHAWAEVYLPGVGWKGFDPTSGVVADNRYIAVAVSRHPETVPPVAGKYLGAPHARPPTLSISVRVTSLKQQLRLIRQEHLTIQ